MPSSPSIFRNLAALGAVLCAALSASAIAAPKTVCTITVNSPDEKEMFRRSLPPGDYQFVELVERGRKDWLASACQQQIQCDALIISGHFDGGEEFYTDRLDSSEYLTVEEMERASCSDSCPGVFANLKEVYLFGCNTLKPEPHQAAGDEIVRSLLRGGQSPTDAARVAALLGERHAESNRDRMRHIFKDVPVIYGFSSKAPLGKYAGPLLEKYFQSAPAGEIGSGQSSARLLSLFGPSSMTVTNGLRNGELQSSLRGDACRFLDDRLAADQKVKAMHEMLQRDMTEVRMLLGHLERFAASIAPVQRIASARTVAAFDAIAADTTARKRYLDFARDADETSVRTRMMALARNVGWLTPAQEQAEFVRTIAERIQRGTVDRGDVDLACTRSGGGDGGRSVEAFAAGALQTGKVAAAAALACMGSTEAHAHVVRAVTSASAEDVAIAQTYLKHRPMADAGEMRAMASAIRSMTSPAAQVRALETLAKQRVADTEILRGIAGLFAQARSVDVQRAIARILIRSDHASLGQGELVRTLKQYRLKSPDGDDVIDALIRVLQAS